MHILRCWGPCVPFHVTQTLALKKLRKDAKKRVNKHGYMLLCSWLWPTSWQCNLQEERCISAHNLSSYRPLQQGRHGSGQLSGKTVQQLLPSYIRSGRRGGRLGSWQVHTSQCVCFRFTHASAHSPHSDSVNGTGKLWFPQAEFQWNWTLVCVWDISRRR